MTVKRTIEHTPVPVHIWTEEVTHDAVQQLEHIAHLPFVYPHVAAMPDVHPGIGASVGSVIPTRDAIVPAAVGVDIGCGMIAARLSIDALLCYRTRSAHFDRRSKRGCRSASTCTTNAMYERTGSSV